jgi:TRAP-type C4-dicarboxylate transport system permease small subunit
MRRFAKILMRVDDLAAAAGLFLCGALLLAMAGIAGLGVIFRFGLQASLSWSEELDTYLFIWLTCIGAAAGIKLQVHPQVMAFANRFSPRSQKKLAIASDGSIFALGVVLAWQGGHMIALMGTETASSIPISMIYPYLAIPVAGALFMLHALAHVTQIVTTATPQRVMAHGQIES